MEQLKTKNQKLETAVGTVKGPGETLHEFTFIAPDPDRQLKHGEFVYYTAPVGGSERQILGRITGRTAVKLFPDTFMADPAVPPHTVAAMLGYESDATELFELTVTVLGFYDEHLQDFTNPRVPPQGGAPVFIAADGTLTELLSRGRQGRLGSAYIGDLLSRDPGAVPVALDVRGFTSTHLAIIASTGSGKSYLAGVLLEELLMPYNRAAVLVIDPHGEYDTLQQVQNLESFRDGGYSPRVRIFRPHDLRVRISSLTLPDLRYLLPNLSEKMHYQLGRAFRYAVRTWGEDKYTLEQLLRAVREVGDGAQSEDEAADEDPTTGALIWRLGAALRESSIFNDFENIELDELFQPGMCTLVQLNEVERREQQVIVATLLRRVYQARIDTEKGKLQRTDRNHMPFPVFSLLEEAHNFAPANADAVSSDQLKTILSEGRKFGVGVGLISQRPGRLDSDVLSQCMTQCIMRITNPIDQNRIAESVESVGRDMLKELPALSKGQVIVSGASVNTPLMLRVRTRRTEHGGEDINAPAQWRHWFEHEQPAQDAENALFAERELERDEDGMLWA
ncbi:MAG: ATP-binding protein [Caldilineaceae bacterium SB0675_bin_29]|uniref:ATP-binding protein n=1 Tax=Caldilineaceae bacterium SB0675_bin_29 TaxID=2605266 RepID=A0A6B1G0V3_9CHLR|nr:ATP-binding protein [Caldilineaceae bacterium SB0675_bin_29]